MNGGRDNLQEASLISQLSSEQFLHFIQLYVPVSAPNLFKDKHS